MAKLLSGAILIAHTLAIAIPGLDIRQDTSVNVIATSTVPTPAGSSPQATPSIPQATTSTLANVIAGSTANVDSTLSGTSTTSASTTAAAPASARVDGEILATDSNCVLTSLPLSTMTNTVLMSVMDDTSYWSTGYITLPATVDCRCGSVHEGVFISVGNDGVTSTFCETTTNYDFAIPLATSLPESNPGDPLNGAWADVNCDYGSLVDSGSNPSQQWNDSGAGAAYEAVAAAWKQNPKTFTKFTNFVANFFNGPPVPDCDMLGKPNCQPVNCGQGGDPNAPVNSPAGYLILNSIVGLHNAFDSIYTGLSDALAPALSEAGNFVSTFSPITQDIEQDKQDKLDLDFLQLALTLVIAPSFHSLLVRTSFVKQNPNWFGTGVDVTYGTLGVGMAAVKDARDSQSPLPVQNDITAMVGALTQQWKNMTQGAVSAIMNDPDKLLTEINNGGWAFLESDQTSIEIEVNLEKVLFAAMTSMVWITGSTPNWPAIITTDGMAQSDTCEGWDPHSYGSELNLGDDRKVDFDDAADRVCNGNEAYFLIGATRDSKEECSTLEGCTGVVYTTGFKKLLGTETLDGSRWQGLTKEDIVLNAVNTWNAAGKTNNFAGFQDADFQDEALLKAMREGDIKASRNLVHIPVCSIDHVRQTYHDDPGNTNGNPNFPCPPP